MCAFSSVCEGKYACQVKFELLYKLNNDLACMDYDRVVVFFVRFKVR